MKGLFQIGAESSTVTPGGRFWAGFAIIGITGLLMLALLLPSISIVVRRLHDTNKSGFWYLGAVIAMTIIGSFPEPLADLSLLVSLALLIWCFAVGSKSEGARFDDPSGKRRPQARSLDLQSSEEGNPLGPIPAAASVCAEQARRRRL